MLEKDLKRINSIFYSLGRSVISSNAHNGTNNLLSLMKFIDDTPLLKDFIEHNYSKPYSAADFKRDPYRPYNLPVDISDRFSYTYQLLKFKLSQKDNNNYYMKFAYKYSLDEREGFCILDFHQDIIVPFLEYISTYIDSLRSDNLNKSHKPNGDTFNSCQINIPHDHSVLYATMNVNPDILDLCDSLNNLIAIIKQDIVESEDEKLDLIELLESLVEEVMKPKPKRTSLKAFVSSIKEVLTSGIIIYEIVELINTNLDKIPVLLS